MSLARLTPWLQRAQAEKFAIGAFNVNTLEQAQAIVAAAEAEQAPAILQVSHNALLYMGSGNNLLGLRYIAAIGREAANMVTVPIILHLDHGTYDEVIAAANLGFTSVMFDGGDLPYAENIAQTQRLRQITAQLNVNLEAELGEVPKPGGSQSEEKGALTDPAEVAEFVAQTQIDSLAIALGSAHGGRRKETSLDIERLKAIRAVTATPLVLHGSSGVVDKDVLLGIELGLCKVNVATQLNQAFTQTIRRKLAEQESMVDPRPYLKEARIHMQAEVQKRMRLFGTSGKAV